MYQKADIENYIDHLSDKDAYDLIVKILESRSYLGTPGNQSLATMEPIDVMRVFCIIVQSHKVAHESVKLT